MNLDTYRRACELPGSELIVLLGEATFHQVHGGVATNARSPDVIHGIMEEYQRIRGERYAPPDKVPVYFGGLPAPCLPWVLSAARQAAGGS